MAVYTILDHHELQKLLSNFDLPELKCFEGASSGIENTTYFLTLTSGTQYVLTIFEYFTSEQLFPYISLTTILNQHNLPVPCPCLDKCGVALQQVAGKVALLFPRASGKHIGITDITSCEQIGSVLSRIHLVTTSQSINLSIINPCGLAWMKETFLFVKSSLDPTDQKMLEKQILLSEDLERRQLPQGIIHGDLFRDNVLFDQQKVTAVIDFYNAGRDILLLDLAIAANDWCYPQADQSLNNKINALLAKYNQNRILNDIEKSSWNECLQVAAARFWLSRQKRVVLAQQGGNFAVKDPIEYKNLLLFHLQNRECTNINKNYS